MGFGTLFFMINAIISSPVGMLRVGLEHGKLTSIEFLPKASSAGLSPGKEFKPIIDEIKAYFTNPQHRFNLPLSIQGTDFQKTVWNALQHIPSGETVSYQALAKQLKTSPRAIGNACRRNPLPLIVPCHRVVAKTGLGGFAGKRDGELINIKRALLQHEGSLGNR